MPGPTDPERSCRAINLTSVATFVAKVFTRSDRALGTKEGEMTWDRGEDYLVLLSGKLVGTPDLDFSDLFATAPQVVKKGIGLVPADCADFGFDKR